MKKYIYDLKTMLDNELETTLDGIEQGRQYEFYFENSLKALLAFLEHVNNEFYMNFDMESIECSYRSKYKSAKKIASRKEK